MWHERGERLTVARIVRLGKIRSVARTESADSA